MENEKLKPCPHCGGAASLAANYSYRHRTFFVFVKCDVCGAQGKLYSSEDTPEATEWKSRPCDDAAAAWNMRTDERGQIMSFENWERFLSETIQRLDKERQQEASTQGSHAAGKEEGSAEHDGTGKSGTQSL